MSYFSLTLSLPELVHVTVPSSLNQVFISLLIYYLFITLYHVLVSSNCPLIEQKE